MATVRSSLDGALYDVYTRTFTVDPAQVPAIYAFAADALTNRLAPQRGLPAQPGRV